MGNHSYKIINGMNNEQKIVQTDYQKMQLLLDSFIRKFGSHKTVDLLESMDNNTSITIDESKKIQVLKEFVVAQCIAIYELDRDEFYTNETNDYRKARMVCYKLFETYTKCSHSHIGRIFGERSKRSIQHHCAKCSSYLELYADFIQNYRLLEKITVAFLAQLN